MIYLNKYQLCFYRKRSRKKGNVGPLLTAVCLQLLLLNLHFDMIVERTFYGEILVTTLSQPPNDDP